MPLLTINNLLTHEVDVQDPSGLSGLSIKVAPSGTYGPKALTLEALEAIEPQLAALATAASITWSVQDDPNSQADALPEGVRTGLVTPVTALVGDQMILTNLTVPGAVAVSLPAALPIGKVLKVADGKGDAGANNVTITPAGGGTINGAANFVLSSNNAAVLLEKVSATAWVAYALQAAGSAPSGAAGGDLTGAYPNPTIGANKVTEAKLALTLVGEQALAGAGAVDVTHRTTFFTSSGAGQALTLADGTVVGQRKTIAHVVDGGSGVLTPAHPAHFATYTFTAVHDFVELEWNGAGWEIVAYGGGTIA